MSLHSINKGHHFSEQRTARPNHSWQKHLKTTAQGPDQFISQPQVLFGEGGKGTSWFTVLATMIIGFVIYDSITVNRLNNLTDPAAAWVEMPEGETLPHEDGPEREGWSSLGNGFYIRRIEESGQQFLTVAGPECLETQPVPGNISDESGLKDTSEWLSQGEGIYTKRITFDNNPYLITAGVESISIQPLQE